MRISALASWVGFSATHLPYFTLDRYTAPALRSSTVRSRGSVLHSGLLRARVILRAHTRAHTHPLAPILSQCLPVLTCSLASASPSHSFTQHAVLGALSHRTRAHSPILSLSSPNVCPPSLARDSPPCTRPALFHALLAHTVTRASPTTPLTHTHQIRDHRVVVYAARSGGTSKWAEALCASFCAVSHSS